MFNGPARVLVAVLVWRMLPPVMVRPFEAEREVRLRPPEKVEVAEEVFWMEPPERTRP